MKFSYFKLTEALGQVKDDFSSGTGADKLASVSKLLGKTVANVGMLAVGLGVGAAKMAPEVIGKMARTNLDERGHSMSAEDVERHEAMVQRGDEAHRRRMEERE